MARAATLPPGFEETTLASGLSKPTNVAWAPDGRMFIAQKAGALRVVSAGGTLAAAAVIDISGHVNSRGDRGLLGIALDKDFATNHYLYLLYTYEGDPADPNGSKVGRLTRIVVNDDNTVGDPGAPESVLLGSVTTAPCPAPANDNDCMPSDASSHSIGTVRVDPTDGSLWVGQGDGAAWERMDTRALRTYDERTSAGKILHIDRDGHGLPGHAFCPNDLDLTHVCTKVYAKGFRNPYRFALRPSGGPLVGDVGWSDREELDLIVPGRNYGWPCYEGVVHTVLYEDLDDCAPEYAKEGTGTADSPPAYDYSHQFAGGGGGAVIAGPTYTAASYPSSYWGRFFFGDYVQGFIRRALVTPQGTIAELQAFAGDWHGVDLELAPNGNLAYVDFGNGAAGAGSVKEIRYSPDNSTPVAVASANPSSGPAPLQVQFTGSASHDADDDALSFDWDFGDGSPHSSEADPQHDYDLGNYTAELTVTDGRGGSARATVNVSAGNAAPQASITAPADQSLFRNGQEIHLHATATDAQDASFPDQAFQWHAILHHDTHVHDLADLSGPDPLLESSNDHDANTYLEISLTVTDSGGLTDSETISLRPETVSLTLDSVPPGAPLGYAGESVIAPDTRQSAIDFRTTISAAAGFSHGGHSYRFSGWSDGGARLHDITVPDQPTVLVANYETDAPAPWDAALGAIAPLDRKGPSVRLFRSGPGRVTSLRGDASDPGGVRHVDVALKHVGRRGCAWWLRRLGRMTAKQLSCDAPRFMRADLTKVAKGRWRWKLSLGASLDPGRYRAILKATDAAGNASKPRAVRLGVHR